MYEMIACGYHYNIFKERRIYDVLLNECFDNILKIFCRIERRNLNMRHEMKPVAVLVFQIYS